MFPVHGGKYYCLLFSHHILMSVLRIRLFVMKTPIAQITTVLTAVLVNRDSLEMEQLAMVNEKVESIGQLSYCYLG